MFKKEPRFLNSYEVTEVQAIFYINRSKVRFTFIYRQFLNTHFSLQKKNQIKNISEINNVQKKKLAEKSYFKYTYGNRSLNC